MNICWNQCLIVSEDTQYVMTTCYEDTQYVLTTWYVIAAGRLLVPFVMWVSYRLCTDCMVCHVCSSGTFMTDCSYYRYLAGQLYLGREFLDRHCSIWLLMMNSFLYLVTIQVIIQGNLDILYHYFLLTISFISCVINVVYFLYISSLITARVYRTQ